MARRQSSQRAICERMERAKAEGDLPPDTDIDGLCAYLGAILQGMSVQASSGAPKAQLEALVETSLAMWPRKIAPAKNFVPLGKELLTEPIRLSIPVQYRRAAWSCRGKRDA